MRNGAPNMVSVMRALHNDKCLCLFNSIALTTDHDTVDLMSNMNVKRTQFYKIMCRLLESGLIRRIQGKYSLTAMGRVVYYAQSLIGAAVQDYWKFAVLDSLQDIDMPKEEHQEIIKTMIDDKLRAALGAPT